MTNRDGVWVVAACFNEDAVISRFIERVLAVPGVDQLVLIDIVTPMLLMLLEQSNAY